MVASLVGADNSLIKVVPGLMIWTVISFGITLLVLWRFAFGLPAAFIFYVFEVVIVVTIQAFIFAALSAIYIGSAIEPEH